MIEQVEDFGFGCVVVLCMYRFVWLLGFDIELHKRILDKGPYTGLVAIEFVFVVLIRSGFDAT